MIRGDIRRMNFTRKNIVIAKLESKVAELKKILPNEAFDFKDFYFAGGCIYSLWNGNEPKDYDLFCRNRKAANRLLNYFKQNREKCNIITENAISMGEFQFIVKHIGKPEVQVGRFDFKHNMFFYDGNDFVALVDWKYLESKKLEFNSARARNVLNILSRIPKFIERGMEISQSEIYSILECGTRPTRIIGERISVKRFINKKNSY